MASDFTAQFASIACVPRNKKRAKLPWLFSKVVTRNVLFVIAATSKQSTVRS
jgi:hypothetical protein